MKQNKFLWNPGRYLLALGLAALFLAGVARAETLKVSQQNQSLYTDRDFASTPLAPVPVGAAVNVLEKSGDWYKVTYQDKTGWINQQAFPQAQAPAFNLKSMLTGGGVQQTKTDEVALAGKGFTPEVESSYRQKHPEAKFAEVDKLEAYRLDPAKLQAFIKEGGLNP